MSYKSIYDMTTSASLIGRMTVCAVIEGKLVGGMAATTNQWVQNNLMQLMKVVFAAGWGVAWDTAVAAGATDPGGDESVITDAMILAAIQALS